MSSPLVILPVLNGVCVALTSTSTKDEIRLLYEMPLREAEAALVDFQIAVARARAWRPDAQIAGILG